MQHTLQVHHPWHLVPWGSACWLSPAPCHFQSLTCHVFDFLLLRQRSLGPGVVSLVHAPASSVLAARSTLIPKGFVLPLGHSPFRQHLLKASSTCWGFGYPSLDFIFLWLSPVPLSETSAPRPQLCFGCSTSGLQFHYTSFSLFSFGLSLVPDSGECLPGTSLYPPPLQLQPGPPNKLTKQ